MAHFAQLDTDNKVVNVMVVADEHILDNEGKESEEVGIAFCHNLLPSAHKFVQTSYNNNMRGKFAGIGDTWDGTNFISPSVEETE